jgi:ABC-type ATPase involved in cell division
MIIAGSELLCPPYTSGRPLTQIVWRDVHQALVHLASVCDSAAMIRFDNVGMRYGPGDEVLSDVSFHLKPGSFHFLTGKSGAGKSSLLKVVYLSRRPSRGIVQMMDQDLKTASRGTLVSMRQRIGVVFQDYRLLDHLSTFENVALPLRIKGAGEEGNGSSKLSDG